MINRPKNISKNLDQEDKDLPRLVNYLDDPMEVGWNDYFDHLNVSASSKQSAFEKWLNDQEQIEYPDPPEIPYDDTKTFEEFDSSFASSTVEF